MHQLIVQLAALVGLLVLLPRLWGTQPIEHTLVVSAASALAVYGALVVGAAVVQRVVAEVPPDAPADPTAPPADPPTETP